MAKPADSYATTEFVWRVVDGVLELWAKDIVTGEWYQHVGGGATYGRASVLLLAPSMSPGDGDIIHWLIRDSQAEADGDIPAGFSSLTTFEMGDGWEDNGNVNVLVRLVGEEENWRYAHVEADGTFTEVTLNGLTPVTVGCLGIDGIADERPALWVGVNDDGPFGGISDPGAPATDFRPIGVGSDDVFLSYEQLQGTILDGCATLTQALDVLKNLAGGGGTIQRWGLGSQERIDLQVTGEPIAVPDTGDWDNFGIREPGQVIYDEATEKWVAVWTGRGDQNLGSGAIGLATSDDGLTGWTPDAANPVCPGSLNENPTLWNGNEDPHLAKDLATGFVYRDPDGRALLYCESKVGSTQVGVNLWRSAPGTLGGWTLYGQVKGPGSTGQWDASDRDSPVVFFWNDNLWMLTEGRNLPDQQGWIGLDLCDDLYGTAWSNVAGPYWQVWSGSALSSDAPFDDPDADGTWFDLSLVPDDIDLIDGLFVLLAHGQRADEAYRCGRFVTAADPFTVSGSSWTGGSVEWDVIPVDPIDAETDTIMFFGNDPTKAVHIDDTGNLRAHHVVPSSVVDVNERIGAVEDDVALLADLPDDLADLTTVVDGVSDDLDAAELVLTAEGALNDAQDLLIGRTAPRTDVAAFDGTTGDFGGPTPGGTLTLPDAVIESTTPPYAVTSSCSAFAFNPAPPTAAARLIGAKIRLSLDGVDLTDVVANVILVDMGTFQPLPARLAATGGWTAADPIAYVVADIDDPDVGFEQELVIHLDPIIDAPSVADYGLVVGYQQVGGSPDVGAGSAITVQSVDWLWDESGAAGTGAFVATDPIWSAVGDIVVGTGDDEAEVLSAGDVGAVLVVDPSASPGVRWQAGSPFYGSGADGNVTISGTTTLTTDMYYNNLEVTGTLITKNHRVFVAGVLSGNGTIHSDGVAGSGLSGGAALTAGTLGGAGNGGAATATVGSQGAAGLTQMIGATSGAGGAGSAGAGGAGRTAVPPTAAEGGIQILNDPLTLRTGRAIGSSSARLTGGWGGGGGGGDSTNAGGGGGSGGGVCFVAARRSTFTGTISANGGAGATRASGNVGGGGGGGGGGVIFLTSQFTVAHTATANGGAGGSGVGTGSNGTAGSAGTVTTFLGVR